MAVANRINDIAGNSTQRHHDSHSSKSIDSIGSFGSDDIRSSTDSGVGDVSQSHSAAGNTYSSAATNSSKDKVAGQKRAFEDTDNTHENNTNNTHTDINDCIENMVSRRDQLRSRFKDWAESIDDLARKLRCITDNALVNQSIRLESILEDGRVKINDIVAEQNHIHGQLASFVSMLSTAQSQIFGTPGISHMASLDSSGPTTRESKATPHKGDGDRRQWQPNSADSAKATRNAGE
ncbi:hypothetical protein LPJ66_003368 [Kickxella alabastrina]|uniref:Uncharacterized protein n=1 Tax=Kickxella alabastrina TaxID=61397 RepID=A0ACC1IP28_9FUNG|nr:hypothetical protein LPJ66_003368 [Kickxella alabastrina]